MAAKDKLIALGFEHTGRDVFRRGNEWLMFYKNHVEVQGDDDYRFSLHINLLEIIKEYLEELKEK